MSDEKKGVNENAIDVEALELLIEDKGIKDSQDEGEVIEAPSTQEIIAPIFSVVSKLVVPNWNISDEEVEALSEAYSGLLDKYYPEGVQKKFSVEISALLVTAMIVAPRVGTPRVKPVEKDEKEPDVENDSGE